MSRINELAEPLKLSTISEFLRGIGNGRETVFDLSKQMEDGKEATVIKLSYRELSPEVRPAPIRSESPSRNHEFHDCDTFIKWLILNGTPSSVVLGNVGKLAFHCVVDESQREGFEMVSFVPQIHPLWKPWEELVVGRAMEVLAFARFAMERRRQVVEPDGRELALMFSQLTADSKITVNRGQGNRAINGVMVETTIQGVRKDFPVELPEMIRVRVPLFIGLPPADIEIDLLVHSPDTKSIVVFCSAAALMETKIQCFLQFADKISESCQGVVGLGSVETSAWDYRDGV